jgi:SSS family solute:Na+ symporter
VVTDFVQGLIAYLLGPLMLIGLIVWLARHGHGMDQIPPDKWSLPRLGSTSGPLFLFSLVFTGAIGGGAGRPSSCACSPPTACGA